MIYNENIEEKEEWSADGEIKCPFCDLPFMHNIMRTYTGYHSKETMIHCDNCDNIWIVIYKFSHIVKLNKEIVK